MVQFSPSPVSGTNIRVYVTGAVAHPGVYPVHSGDRVADAVDAAGGPAADADTEAVNFALRIQDEEQIHIPRIGEIIAPDASAAASGAPIPDLAATAAPAASPQLVDINHADVKLLRTLPGVGQTRAANIVNSRQTAGPFKQPADLVQRKLVTQKIFDQDKNQIEALP
ncbi:MAG TPA: helix-hairpin-helix domain-containing protein [Steroidobacteraceae bacterium]|nr:helix-hairpin-helix domain-containing protein [Steroidobacteraceae bacterium]